MKVRRGRGGGIGRNVDQGTPTPFQSLARSRIACEERSSSSFTQPDIYNWQVFVPRQRNKCSESTLVTRFQSSQSLFKRCESDTLQSLVKWESDARTEVGCFKEREWEGL
jgi:hypothetical protein